MPHPTESAALRAAFSQIERRKTGTRYPKSLRPRALAYCRARRVEGHTLSHIALDLGLAVHTLRHWIDAETPESSLAALSATSALRVFKPGISTLMRLRRSASSTKPRILMYI